MAHIGNRFISTWRDQGCTVAAVASTVDLGHSNGRFEGVDLGSNSVDADLGRQSRSGIERALDFGRDELRKVVPISSGNSPQATGLVETGSESDGVETTTNEGFFSRLAKSRIGKWTTAATLAGSAFLFEAGKAFGDLTTFWDRTDPLLVSNEGLVDTLGANFTGSTVIHTLGAGSAHYDKDRTITRVTYVGALSSGSWNNVDWRIGQWNGSPLDYKTTNHANSTLSSYISNEINRTAPDSIIPIGFRQGLEIVLITFDNLNFNVAAHEDLNLVVSPFNAPGTGGGTQTNRLLAGVVTDDYIGMNQLSPNTQKISQLGLTSDTSLAMGYFGQINGATESEITNSRAYHASYTGSGSPPWNRLDIGKALVKEGSGPQLLNYNNLINTAQGITGIAFDIQNLPTVGNLNEEDFEVQISPQGAFNAGDHPPLQWQAAPEPSSITVTTGSPDRVLIQWPNHSIMNRWLRITVKATDQTGLADPEVYYIGHLLGETTGPENATFTISFADITSIRSQVGNNVDASSTADIDKSGTVSFADISAMRSNVGAQLPQISVP